MSDKKKIRLRWYHIRRILMTGEYIGGIIAGFGLGVMLTAYALIYEIIPHYPGTITCFGTIVAAVGSTIALHAQNRYVTDDDERWNNQDKHQHDSPRERGG